MAQKKQMYNELWESKNQTGGRFIKICWDMRESLAWNSLSLRQQGLYIYLKSQFKKNKNGEKNDKDIAFPKNEKLKIYGNVRTADNDIDKLIDVGMIALEYAGKFARKPNRYSFSRKWQEYGQPNYKVHPGNRRLTKKNLKL